MICVVIRSARAEDAGEMAELICMAWQECAHVLAGSTNQKEVQGVMEDFCRQPENVLSYQYADVIEEENGIAGLVLSFPWNSSTSLAKPIIEKLPGVYKSSELDFKNKVIPMIQTKEAKPDEYYVDSIAVYPKYRGHGIAGKLLKLAKMKSSSFGLGTISLIVKPENKAAIRLYKKHGFAVRGDLSLAGKKYLSMARPV